jgi:hypothetical protein
MENKETKANESINRILYMDNYTSEGLTKREYFAAMALQGLLANDSALIISKVIDAVKAAAALIEELNKTKTND